jgi:hypothetical protein
VNLLFVVVVAVFPEFHRSGIKAGSSSIFRPSCCVAFVCCGRVASDKNGKNHPASQTEMKKNQEKKDID